jgi:hypothetical protein
MISIIQAMLIYGMIVQGRSGNTHYGAAVVGASNKKDESNCQEFGRRTAELVKRLF